MIDTPPLTRPSLPMSTLVGSDGGTERQPLLLEGKALAAERARAFALARLGVGSRERGDLPMPGIGCCTRLAGLMSQADRQDVCDGTRLARGLFWPVPVTLSADGATAANFAAGRDFALVDADDDSGHLDEAGDGAAAGQRGRADPGAVTRWPPGEVRGAAHDAARDARDLRDPGLVAHRHVPDAQPDAPLPRVPDQGRDQGLGQRARSFAARRAQAGRHPSRGACARERGAGEEPLRALHHRAGGPLGGHAPRRSARRAAALAVPPGLRLLAPDRRTRPCQRGQLLHRDRRPPELRTDPEGRARLAAAQARPRVLFWCNRCGGMASSRTGPHVGVDRLQVSGTQVRQGLVEAYPVPADLGHRERREIGRDHDRGCRAPLPPDHAHTTPTIHPNDHRTGDRRCPAL